MPSTITNVDLRFQRKVRGVAPLSRYAVLDDGTLAAAVPDAMEVRTLHLARFDPDGGSRSVETYGVETLRKIEFSPGGGGIGITDDDLYLFRESRKSRFLPDRRASYGDIALAAGGQRFVASFTDMLASGHAVAWGDIGGRALWTKDIAFPVARVAVDRTATYLAVAGESGEILLLDSARTTVVRFRSEAPVTAIATIGPSRTVFAGEGGVGAFDNDGRLLWYHELVGSPVEVALDAEGRTVAVAVRRGENAGDLLFFSADGLPAWDIEFEDSRPTGLSLSANGAFASVTLRDASVCCYCLQHGTRPVLAQAVSPLEQAALADARGDYLDAVRLLTDRLAAVPEDVAACDARNAAIDALRSRDLAAAERAEAVGDYRAANALLDGIVAAAPFDGDAARTRADSRRRWAASARAAGQTAAAAGDAAEAEIHLLEAIEADPFDREARELLSRARNSVAESGIAAARDAIAVGEFPAALAFLADAQGCAGDSPETIALLRQARIGEALGMGNSLYGDRQYAAALFQFKKVLRLDPGNTDATQKIRYSRNFLQDTQLSDRFTRLE